MQDPIDISKKVFSEIQDILNKLSSCQSIDELLTLDEESVESCDKCNDCKSLWDYELNIPDKLLEAVTQETLKTISIRKQIPRDENANTQEGN